MKKLIALLTLIGTNVFGGMQVLNTFTSGELSPHLDARVDFDKYSSGCRTLENFMVLPYGGALKRSGTQYISTTKSNGVARLAPFAVGVDQTYVMEMGDKYIRFYRDGIQLLGTNGLPIEVETPYSSNAVFSIQLAQFADVIYMAHKDYPVYKLERTSTAPTFTMTKVVYTWPPVLDENITDVTIQPSGLSNSVVLTASTNLWTTNNIGSDWVLKQARSTGKISTNKCLESFVSNPIRVEGGWELKTSGTWYGSLLMQASQDNGLSWGDFRVYISDVDGASNYDRSGTETEAGILYRFVYTRITNAADKGMTFSFQNTEPYLSSWVTITNYLSTTQVQAQVNIDLISTNATELWSEGAFSPARGFPRSIEFFENRLFFGGTDYLVNTIWASMTGDYENFKTGTYDDSSLRLSLNSDNIIEWMLARSQMFIGTLGDEWTLSGGDSATPLTPTAVLARKQTSFGSKDGMDALVASDSVIYLQRQGRKLREFEYSLESDSYKSQDASLLAEHITRDGIVQIVEQQQPEPIVWAVRGDGQLVGLTFNKAQNVYGWHRHVTDGKFKSITCIPTDGEDRLYAIVQRTIQGTNYNYVEWFAPIDWGDDVDAWFVDSGLDFDGGEAVNITSASFGTNTLEFFNSTNKAYLNKSYTWNPSTTRWESQTNEYGGGHKLFLDGPRYSVNTIPVSSGDDLLYSSDNISIPAFTNWYWYDNSENGGQRLDTAKLYRHGVVCYATNSLSDGNYVKISSNFCNIRGFYNGIFIVTNATATNFTILYTDGNEVASQGEFLTSATAQRVQKTFTNVQHLAGKTLAVFADGGTQPAAAVTTNGVLTIGDYKNRVIAGLPYSARLSPMYLDQVNSQINSYAKTKNPYRVHFRVNKSGTFNYGSATNAMFPVSVRLPNLTAGSPVPFFSGDPTTKPINAEAETAPEFWVTSTEPLPLELLSLTIFTDVKEYE